MADTFGLSQLGISINVSQWVNTGAMVGLAIFGLIISAIILLLWWYISKHDKKVYLLFRTAEGNVLKENKAEKNIKKRTFKLLYNRNINCTYPESKHAFQKGGKDVYFGVVVNDCCTWLEISDGKLIPPDTNLMNFQVENYHAIDVATRTQPKFWDKYGQMIMIGAAVTMVVINFLIIMFILKSVDKAVEMGSSVIQACGQIPVRAFNATGRVL
jgi:hypothetical protein